MIQIRLVYFCLFIWLIFNPAIGLMCKVLANRSGDLGLTLGQVIPKTQKMILDATLLNLMNYKVLIKGKVEQSWERSSALPFTSV